MTGAGGGPEGRQLARMANARDLPGLHRLPEMLTWPGVIGAGCEPEVVCWQGCRSPRLVRTCLIPGSSVLGRESAVTKHLRVPEAASFVQNHRVGREGQHSFCPEQLAQARAYLDQVAGRWKSERNDTG